MLTRVLYTSSMEERHQAHIILVAIKLAAWCSVKFDVQTNGIHIDTQKEKWHLKSLAGIGYSIKYRSAHSVPPLPVGYPDEEMDVMDMTLGIPTHALPPNVSYVLRLGRPAWRRHARQVWIANFAVRMGSYNREHPGCQILMIVTTGTSWCQAHRGHIEVFLFNGDKIDVENRMVCWRSVSRVCPILNISRRGSCSCNT
jgi:hypothetical protein